MSRVQNVQFFIPRKWVTPWYLDRKPLRVSFSAGLAASGANMSRIRTEPAMPTPTTTAPNMLEQHAWSSAKLHNYKSLESSWLNARPRNKPALVEEWAGVFLTPLTNLWNRTIDCMSRVCRSSCLVCLGLIRLEATNAPPGLNPPWSPKSVF